VDRGGDAPGRADAQAAGVRRPVDRLLTRDLDRGRRLAAGPRVVSAQGARYIAQADRLGVAKTVRRDSLTAAATPMILQWSSL
jgi:hypothetical protein